MPYEITKLADGKYQVKVKHSGQILAKGTTLTKAKSQIRYIGMMEHMKKQNEGDIQSVLISKRYHTEKEADKWIREHGFRINKSTYNFDSPNFYRYRQHAPDETKYDYRIHKLTPEGSIMFVNEKPKKKLKH